MKAISVRQPWAWLILNAGQDIENRSWRTNYRGRIAIHASKNYKKRDYEWEAAHIFDDFDISVPPFGELAGHVGGIVGFVDIVDCVKVHPSKWKDEHSWGFVLTKPMPYRLIPCKGMLGIFETGLNL